MKNFLIYTIAGDIFLIIFLYYIFVQKKSWTNPYMLAALAISILLYLRGIYFIIKWDKERKKAMQERTPHGQGQNQTS